MEGIIRIAASFLFFIHLLWICNLHADVDLQPHRAYYTLTMVGRPTPQSSLADIRGTLLIERNRADAGWTTQHLSETWLYYTNGATEHMRDGYITYENDEGTLLKFHTYRRVNDESVETICKGTAKKKGGVIEVNYTQPEKKKITLPEGTVLPIYHLKALLEAARKGEKIFSQIVFEGRSQEGASETNTFISAQRVGNPGHKFANQPFWPIRCTLYSPKAIYYEPINTTTEDLFATGIIGKYVTDYEIGGVKVQGILDRIELLQGSSIIP